MTEANPLLAPTDLSARDYEASTASDEQTTLTCLGLSLRCPKRSRPYIVVQLLSACLVFAVVIAAVGWHFGTMYPQQGKVHRSGPVRNVIMMISDGFGPASQTLARNYNQYVHKLPVGTQLSLDSILGKPLDISFVPVRFFASSHLSFGSSRTRSSSSFVTDSAAGATAFSCALKTYNGAIGVDPYGIPCGSVLEAAKARGLFTGLVATSRITHATPAAFSAHVSSRNDEDQIAMQQLGYYQLGRRVDLMFGGGLCHFLPNSTASSCRRDNIDVMKEASKLGWNTGTDRAFFDQLSPETRLAPSSFIPFTPDHMSYNIDRDPLVEPSLVEMSQKALALLDKASQKQDTGFFLMIEGSRIDMAAHTNDPSAHIGDILQYNDVIEAVKSFVDSHPDTILISTSDHETGGLSVGHQLGPMYPVYAWYPDAITGVKHSAEYIVRQLKQYKGANITDFITNTVFPKWLNSTSPEPSDVAYLSNTAPDADQMEYHVGGIVSDWAGLGWSTHGHSAVDVNLYAYGAHAEELFGNHENTDIGHFISRNLNLDLEGVTNDLKGWNPPLSAKQGVLSNEVERHIHGRHLGL
ncbi:hypothetical protein BSLG_002131 [Batrachochytrium salamandrivorans]|nr:hypothetical protein BSLG_002131 [Batrachochytrium salamandrivorans]